MDLRRVLTLFTLVTATIAQDACLMQQTDLRGGDYRTYNTPNKKVEECKESCLREAACKAFTFSTGSGRCYIKDITHKNESVCSRCISGRADCFKGNYRNQQDGLTNVALNKGVKVEMSRERSGGSAERAIDDSINTNWKENSCTYSSNSGKLNYLQVDLQRVFQIDHIMLYTRSDAEQTLLNGAKVLIDKQVCEVLDGMEKHPRDGYKLDCGEDESKRLGRVVRVEIFGEYVSICEIQIFVNNTLIGDKKNSTADLDPLPGERVGDYYNVAFLKSTNQSSLYGTYVSSKAVDGWIGEQNWRLDSCSHTLNKNYPEWWKVDLGRVYQIDHILVWQRIDCCTYRDEGALVHIGSNFCGRLVDRDAEAKAAGGKLKEGAEKIKCAEELMAGSSVTVSLEKEFITLCEVQVMVNKSKIHVYPDVIHWPGERYDNFTNVAMSKPVSHSSAVWNSVATRANDGATSGEWRDNTCFATNKCVDGICRSYWTVNLTKVYMIDYLLVYGREDCCSERLDGAMVKIGNVNVGELDFGKKATKPNNITISRAGDSVTIDLLNDHLTLCEVQVMVKNDDVMVETLIKTPRWENAALYKETTQSSTNSGPSGRAVDGYPNNTEWRDGSCTHTGSESLNWWEVDLGRMYYIDHINVAGRSDCCQERLANAVIMVDGRTVASFEYYDDQVNWKFKLDNAIQGRYVKVFRRSTGSGNQPLTICEFEVMVDNDYEPGDDAKEPIEEPNNLALGQEASSSSEVAGGAAALVVDGNEEGDFFRGSCSLTGPAQGYNWWSVKLGGVKRVGKITVYPRLDMYAKEVIDGAIVKVEDTVCGVISYIAGELYYTLDCGGRKGATVTVSKQGLLSLCEVVVLGVSP